MDHPAVLAMALHQERARPIPYHLHRLSCHLARHLEDEALGSYRGYRGMILACIRRGKSTLCSVDVPIWTFARNPRARVAVVAYGSDLATGFGVQVRDTIEQHSKSFGFGVRWDRRARHFWETTAGGYMGAFGTGGPIEGRGYDLIVMDDLIANPEQAHSQTQRDSLWEWYLNARGRLEPNGSMILTMAPWSWDDVTGRLQECMAHGGESWDIIRLPCVAGADDWLGRKPGDILWPERFSRAEVDAARMATDGWTWAARYQCTPSPESGAVWNSRQFRYYTTSEGLYRLGPASVPMLATAFRFIVADLALSEKESADYTAIGVFDLIPLNGVNQLVLVDLWRARAQAPAVKAKLWELYRQHQPRFCGIEKAHYGMAYCQELRAEGMMVRELIPDKDKLSRARNASVAFENGRVWFPERAGQMLLDLEHEMLTFPDGAHDDQVDVMSYACNILRTNVALVGGSICGIRRTGARDITGRRYDPHRR